jgi:hypothetical protein
VIEEKRYPNRRLPNGTWECGPKGGSAIWFKGKLVHLKRGGQSLKADWKSVAGHLGAVDESIQTLSTEQSPLYDREGVRVDEFGARMDAIVNDLLWLHEGDSHVPKVLNALREILSANDDEAKKKLLEFSRRIRATRALISSLSKGPRHSFFCELKRLAQELGQPPTKGGLGKALGWNASRLKKILLATGFDWLPTKKRGPAPKPKPPRRKRPQ